MDIYSELSRLESKLELGLQAKDLQRNDFDIREFILRNFVQSNISGLEMNYDRIS